MFLFCLCSKQMRQQPRQRQPERMMRHLHWVLSLSSMPNSWQPPRQSCLRQSRQVPFSVTVGLVESHPFQFPLCVDLFVRIVSSWSTSVVGIKLVRFCLPIMAIDPG